MTRTILSEEYQIIKLLNNNNNNNNNNNTAAKILKEKLALKYSQLNDSAPALSIFHQRS